MLADDVILVASGPSMLKVFAKALGATNRYLHDLGVTVAANKASTSPTA